MDEQGHEAGGQAREQIEKMIGRLNVSAAFGEPVRESDVTLIPVANVAYGFGSGEGWGRGTKPGEAEKIESPADSSGGEAGGSGGGGGGLARPMGYIRIDRDGATWQPLEDPMKVSLAGIFLAGWVMFWLMKTIRAFARRR